MEMRNKLLLVGVFCLVMLILSVVNLSVCDDVDLSPASVNQTIQRDHYTLDYNEEHELVTGSPYTHPPTMKWKNSIGQV